MKKDPDSIPATNGPTPDSLFSNIAADDKGAEARKHLSSSDLATVRNIGPYELLDEIARGGMGIVYRARQNNPERIVALKIMVAGEHASEHHLSHFLKKARTTTKLTHPNIVPIYDVGEESGVHYLTMEFMNGQPLSKLITEHTISPAQAVTIMESVTEAVHYAHTQGILHRDLKPGNIIIDERGQPHVTDFGLTHAAFSDSSLSLAGSIFGTPAYMSPEQTRGTQLDPRSDVYALGVILYEMLSGKPPFQAPTLTQLLTQIRTEDAVPLRVLVPTLHPDLETIVMTCLAKEPQRRYHSAEMLALDLRRFQKGEGIAARPPSWLYRLRKKINQYRRLTASLALVAILSVGLYVENLRRLTIAEANTIRSNQHLAAINNLQENQWELVFADDFENVLAPPWYVKGGAWSVKDHHLVGDATASINGITLLERAFRGDLKLQFEASATHNIQQDEIAFAVFTSDKQPAVAGYFVSLNPYGLRIDRNDRTIWTTESLRLEANKTYTFNFERQRDRVRLFVNNDEKPIAEFTDWNAPSAAENSRVGFCTWNGNLEIAHFKIFQTPRQIQTEANLLYASDYHRSHGHYLIAIKGLDSFISENSDSAAVERALYLRAECYKQLGDSVETLSAYKYLNARYPSENSAFQVACWRLLAGEPRESVIKELTLAYPKSSHWKEIALVLIDSILELSTRNPPIANLELASLELERQIKLTLETALACAERIQEPERHEAMGSMASTLLRLSNAMPKKFPSVLHQKALEFDPQLRGVWTNWGRALNSVGLEQDAIEKFQKALELDPKDWQAWRGWGLSLVHLGRDQEALEKFQKSTEYLPTSSFIWRNWGWALFNLGRSQEALEKFQKSIACNPKNAEAWSDLAMTFEEMGRLDEALVACAKSAEISPRAPTNKLIQAAVLKIKRNLAKNF